jgi:hypothetical protein
MLRLGCPVVANQRAVMQRKLMPYRVHQTHFRIIAALKPAKTIGTFPDLTIR